MPPENNGIRWKGSTSCMTVPLLVLLETKFHFIKQKKREMKILGGGQRHMLNGA